MRALAIVALVLSALGALSLLLLGLVVLASDDLEPSVGPGPVLFGAAAALVGAGVATKGLVRRSRATARFGAGVQAGAVLLIGGAYLSAPDPEGAGSALYWALALAIALDVAVLLSAGLLCGPAEVGARR